MNTARRCRDEAGTALVLALVFLSLFGVFVAVILSFADTGVRTTIALRDHDGRRYAADGAVDGALLYVRDDAVRGREGEPCPDFTMNTANNVPVVVECSPQPGSGEVLPGGGDDPSNTPPYAVLTLSQSGAEDGIFIRNNTNPAVPFTIVGDVHSNSNVTAVSGTVSVDGDLTASGPCAGDIQVTGARNCSGAATVTDPGTGNSRYNPKASTRPAEVPLPPCSAAGAPVVMPPGTYTDAGALSSLMSSCNRTFVFQGVYYFDFADTTNISCGSTSGRHIWCVQNGNANFRIIGGTPDPLAAGECLGTAPGVQFIFGGDSRVSFQAGKASICAFPESNRQRIAIYAKEGPQPPAPPDRIFDPVDVVLEADEITTNRGNPRFSNTGDAQAIDDDVASARLRAGQDAELVFEQYAPKIPDDATVDRDTIGIVIRHQEPPRSRVDTLTLDITNGEGASLPQVTASLDPACDNATQFCLRDELRTNRLSIDRDDFDDPSEINGATVRVSYGARSDAGADVLAAVDAVVFELTYTPAPEPQPAPDPFPTQGGCVTQSGLAAITNCAVVTTDGSNTDVRINGTIYAPHSAVFVKTVNRGSQILGRGVVSRVLRVELPASTAVDEPSIHIPEDSGGSSHANRDVIFTARVDGEPLLRARAEYDDTQDPPAVVVRSWAVLR